MADLFAIAQQRLEWIDQRQRVLAQNIANADTPAYQARDIASFDNWVKSSAVTPAMTSPRHMQGRVTLAAYAQTLPPERAVDGNAVNVEAELTKVADGETNTAMVGNLWKTTMGMYLAALGRAG